MSELPTVLSSIKSKVISTFNKKKLEETNLIQLFVDFLLDIWMMNQVKKSPHQTC